MYLVRVSVCREAVEWELLGLVTSEDTCDFARQVPISIGLWTMRSVTLHA
jgi:hypothetical protein